jgi:glycosyltransferase involved in cell wall biosynthesis
MNIVHLAASPFFGGPERQMLGLSRHLSSPWRSIFLSFAEGGKSEPFLSQLRGHGIEALALQSNTPHYFRAVREVADHLRRVQADVVCCHGYKADLVGLRAARQAGVPVVSVSRGWTAATWKVRVYEWLDRRSLPRMDAVVCVSEGQAAKVRRCGVPPDRLRVIRNSIETDRFGEADEPGRAFLQSHFPRPMRRIVGAIGRLSPEKGFRHLVEAAALVAKHANDIGFVLFGDGPLREDLAHRIEQMGLKKQFILAGFRPDLDRWLPNFDLLALPSYTEGLPNVVLEAFASRVPVVATAVGGTPEVVDDGVNGFLVPPGESEPLAQRMMDALANETQRQTMGMAGYYRVRDQFTFDAQCAQYQQLFRELGRSRKPQPASSPRPIEAERQDAVAARPAD